MIGYDGYVLQFDSQNIKHTYIFLDAGLYICQDIKISDETVIFSYIDHTASDTASAPF